MPVAIAMIKLFSWQNHAMQTSVEENVTNVNVADSFQTGNIYSDVPKLKP